MKKNYISLTTILIGLIVCSNTTAQLPYTESFESATGYTPDVNVIDNLSDYFARMDTDCSGPPDPCESNFTAGYIGWDGTYYWAGEDHDDPGVSNAQTLCIQLDPIDISMNTTGRIEISMLAAANDVSNAYDPTDGDGVFVTYSVDGGTSQAVHTWAYYTPNGGTTEFLAYDEDNNGTVDGSESDILTETFASKSRILSIAGNNLVIRICAHSNASSEEWAVDNIQVSSAMALPVELVNFEGEQIEKAVLLKWSTSSEINNAGFQIQKSMDGINWTNLDFVEGQGNSNQNSIYQYHDLSYLAEQNYYRLAQIDFDGTTTYSKIISIENKTAVSYLLVYPNPSKGNFNVQISNPHLEPVRLSIYDVLGRMVLAKSNLDPIAFQNIPFTLHDEGVYYAILQKGNELYSKSILVCN